MAEETQEDFRLTSKMKLDDDMIKRLSEVDASIPDTRKALAALKRAGVNVRVLEEHLDWAENVAKELKESFV